MTLTKAAADSRSRLIHASLQLRLTPLQFVDALIRFSRPHTVVGTLVRCERLFASRCVLTLL